MENMAENPEVSWRSQSFRQNVITKIEEAIRQSGNPTTKSVPEMETHVFQKAKTREEYLGFVARLIIHVREMMEEKLKKTQAAASRKTTPAQDKAMASTCGRSKRVATSITPKTALTQKKARMETVRSYRQSAATDTRLQVAVEREDKAGLTDLQRLNFMDAVGAAMLELPEEADVPTFHDTRIIDQYLVISSVDEASRDWLSALVPTLKLWGTTLRAFPASEMPKPCEALVWLSGKDQEPETALKLLHIQNKGLEANKWRILDSKQEECGLRLVVGIEEATVDHLRGCNFQLFYKTGIAKVILIGAEMSKEHPEETGKEGPATSGSDEEMTLEEEPGNTVESKVSSEAQEGMATSPTVAKD